jgi:hypothetical protein
MLMGIEPLNAVLRLANKARGIVGCASADKRQA